MGANRLEKFETVVVNRRDIAEADYNPRKISDGARKKLTKFLRENGLWEPLIVNKRTMTLVSGHQRLSAMDTILRKDDYDLTVAMVDVDEELEVKGNVFLNNASAQGEWDIFKLEGLKEMFPDIDYENDFGFDESEIAIMFSFDKQDDEEKEADNFRDVQKYRDIKKQIRNDEKKKVEVGNLGAEIDKEDYVVHVVFPNNYEKHEFMRKIRKPENEKYIKSSILIDIYNHIYDILHGAD